MNATEPLKGADKQTESSVTSILSSFCLALPNLDSSTITYKTAKPSGQSTVDAAPPVFLYKALETRWNISAEEAIKLAVDRNAGLSTLMLPTTFRQLRLNTETDVVNSQMIYFLVPILQILNDIFGNTFEVLAENVVKEVKEVPDEVDSKDPLKKKVKPKKAPKLEVVVRFDMHFKKVGGDNLAVIEFKRRGQFHRQDFGEAKRKDLMSEQEVDSLLREGKQQLKAGYERTVLTGNGLTYTKQVANYAVKAETRYVALFNWENLLLYDFNEIDLDNRLIGNTGELSWIENPANFRRDMLGFLYEAFIAGDMEVLDK